MLFNSIDFAIFLPIVFFLYWFVTNHNLRLQNSLIVIASYVFYGWWDWRFLSLIIFSTLVDYSVGIRLNSEQSEKRRKILLWTSILVNLGFLGFFKYFNFFQDNFISAFSFFGVKINAGSLNIILPVGISFYTFQTMSYTIDVYRKELEPTHDFIAFSAFVSFFPQLVAGPIERAKNLLPQFYRKRFFDYTEAADGMRQTLWGFFKKIVIADNCAEFANLIFNNSEKFPGSILFLGAIFFSFQIYGDFSGYSDIAIGISRVFGFNLKRNFAFPYFSRDIAEFWRRWHISLSSWFRDYLYIPLGGSKSGKWINIRNTFIIFVVSGFWHGANWTFIAWGTLNAIYFLPLLVLHKNRQHLDTVSEGKRLPSLKEASEIAVTFFLVMIGWVFFRADNILHALKYLCTIFSKSFFVMPHRMDFVGASMHPLVISVLIIIFVIAEWFGRDKLHVMENFNLPRLPRWLFYLAVGFLIIVAGNFNKTEFIYFAF
ncbi:MAG: MBOAT family protein [Candidatus Cloacimonetes bacterium]|nr:MBOAT family protein [Candidatus Cloacimonadota bacterium]